MTSSNLVVQLNALWRVVATDDGTRWVLQRSHNGAWRNRSTCGTRPALENIIRAWVGDVDPAARAILDGLPANVYWPPKTAAPKKPTRRKKERVGSSWQ